MKRFLLVLITISFVWNVVSQTRLNKEVSNFETQNIASVSQLDSKYFPLGYCRTGAEIKKRSGFGLKGKDFNTVVCIKLPATTMKRYVGDKISAINVGFANNVSNMTVFVKNKLNSKSLATKKIDGKLGWNQVVLDNPIVIENKDYYIGYSGTIPKGTGAAARLETEVSENALIIKNQGRFDDYTTYFQGANSTAAVQALLEGDESHFTNTLELVDFNWNKYHKFNEKITVPFILKNLGKNDVTKCEITCLYGTESIKKEFEIDCKPETKVTVDFELQLSDIDKVKFKITKVNDVKKDITILDKEFILYKDEDLITRKVLLEQFTTEQCQFCPEGARIIKNVIAKKGYKDKIIWLGHHAGFGKDKYTLEGSISLTSLYGGKTYAPAMMLDRTYFESFARYENAPIVGFVFEKEEDSMRFVEQMLNKALSVPTFLTVNIKQENPTVNTTNDVKFIISGTYTGKKLPKDELFVSVYISEDGIKTTNQKGVNGTYTHDHLIRKMLGTVEGTKITWNGNQYSVEVGGKIKSSWNKEKLKVTAFVHKNLTNEINDLEVLNVEQQKLQISTGVNSVYAKSLNVFVKNGKVVVNGEYNSVKVFTIEGKELENNDLVKGAYIVKVKNGNDWAVKKILVL